MTCASSLRPWHRTYTVEWTGTGADSRFEIDLYYCGSMCMEVSSIWFRSFPFDSGVVFRRDRTE